MGPGGDITGFTDRVDRWDRFFVHVPDRTFTGFGHFGERGRAWAAHDDHLVGDGTDVVDLERHRTSLDHCRAWGDRELLEGHFHLAAERDTSSFDLRDASVGVVTARLGLGWR